MARRKRPGFQPNKDAAKAETSSALGTRVPTRDPAQKPAVSFRQYGGPPSLAQSNLG